VVNQKIDARRLLRMKRRTSRYSILIKNGDRESAFDISPLLSWIAGLHRLTFTGSRSSGFQVEFYIVIPTQVFCLLR